MDYFAAVRSFDRPTDQHFRAYADHVSGAHSWYKHLPVEGPGEAFFMYPVPNNHTAWIETAAGSTEPRPFITVREDNARGFNVIEIDYQPGDVVPDHLPPLDYVTGGVDTATYRERFGIMGYWNYSRPGQPADEALDAACAGIRWRTDDGTEADVPRSVLEAGLVYLNASVHPLFDEHSSRSRTDQVDTLVDAQRQVTDIIFGPSQQTYPNPSHA